MGGTILVTIVVNGKFSLGGLEFPLNGFSPQLLRVKARQAFLAQVGTELKAQFVMALPQANVRVRQETSGWELNKRRRMSCLLN